MTTRNNAKHLEAHVSGPFRNSKYGKSHWIVVLGNNGQTWLLKPEFVTGYLQCLLSDIATHIDIEHCENIVRLTFANMNLGLKVYGSVFRRIMENHHKLSKDFLLFIHVTALMYRLWSKYYMRH